MITNNTHLRHRAWRLKTSVARFSDSMLLALGGQSDAVLCSFLLGCLTPIFQASLFDPSVLLVWLTAFFLFCLKYRQCFFLAAYFLGLAWSSFCFTQQINQSYPSNLERLSVQVEGDVLGLPVNRHGNYKFEFRVTHAYQQEGQTIKALTGQKILLSCYRCKLSILPAQQWRFTVRLKRPHGYASWGAFDYEKFLFRKRVVAKGYVRLKEDNALLAQTSGGVDLWRWKISQQLHDLSQRFNQEQEHRLTEAMPPPGLAIVRALAIGDKSGLTKAQRAVFQDTGVSHLMAISGLHVGLVFVGVSFIVGWLLWPVARLFEVMPRQHLVLLPALASAIFYSALAGFAVSTQRALTMLCVYVFCRLLVRDISLFKILLISMCLIVAASPWSILDIGFWLSCGAVFIIALTNYGVDSSKKGALSLIRLQPKLWLGMSPMTILFFGQVSLVSPLVNLLAVPLFCLVLIPATLLAVLLQQVGIGEGLLSSLSHCFNGVYAALAWLVTTPLAKWYSEPWFWLHWGLSLGLLVSLVRRTSWVLRLLLFSALLIATVFNPNEQLHDDELDLVLLDVGQGLAMVLIKNDYVLVYDTGPRYGTGFSAAEAVVLPYLRSRSISEVNTLIISHADNDHIGGYQTLIDAFKVGDVLTSRVDKLPNADNCVAGQTWHAGATQLSIISPDRNTPSGSNNRSCVLLVEHFGTRLLITGDIEKQVERYLLNTRREMLAANVMLVPHQGSKTSSTAEFIAAVQPQLALLAAGYRNHYGHPHKDVVQRYAEREINLVSSIENGSVRLTIDQKGWRRASYRDAQRRFWHHQKKPNWD